MTKLVLIAILISASTASANLAQSAPSSKTASNAFDHCVNSLGAVIRKRLDLNIESGRWQRMLIDSDAKMRYIERCQNSQKALAQLDHRLTKKGLVNKEAFVGRLLNAPDSESVRTQLNETLPELKHSEIQNIMGALNNVNELIHSDRQGSLPEVQSAAAANH